MKVMICSKTSTYIHQHPHIERKLKRVASICSLFSHQHISLKEHLFLIYKDHEPIIFFSKLFNFTSVPGVSVPIGFKSTTDTSNKSSINSSCFLRIYLLVQSHRLYIPSFRRFSRAWTMRETLSLFLNLNFWVSNYNALMSAWSSKVITLSLIIHLVE